MLKYAKVINDETGLCEVGTGTNTEYYISLGMEELDVEKSDVDNNWYLSELCPHKTDVDKLNDAKEAKVLVNDVLRDNALNQGVTYKDVLFDSDTDQKVNLLAIVSTMDDEQTVLWFGKDNQPLECNRQDLMNIGGLITQLHNFCWNKNALIKAEINQAETIEEVEAVEIDYTIPAEEQDSEAVSEGE